MGWNYFTTNYILIEHLIQVGLCLTESTKKASPTRTTCWKVFTPLSRNYLALVETASAVFLASFMISKWEILQRFTAMTTTKQEKMSFRNTVFFVSVSKKFSCLRATKNGIPKIFSKSPSLFTHQKKISSFILITFHLLKNLHLPVNKLLKKSISVHYFTF